MEARSLVAAVDIVLEVVRRTLGVEDIDLVVGRTEVGPHLDI